MPSKSHPDTNIQIRRSEPVVSQAEDLAALQALLAPVLQEAKLRGFNMAYVLSSYDPMTYRRVARCVSVGDPDAIRGLFDRFKLGI